MTSLLDLFVGTAYAQDAAPPGGASGNQMLLMMALLFGIWYVLIIRPQGKQQKSHEAMVKGLKKGDQVVTAAGIYGKVHEVQDQALLLEVSKGVRIKIDKQKVSRLDAATPSTADAK